MLLWALRNVKTWVSLFQGFAFQAAPSCTLNPILVEISLGPFLTVSFSVSLTLSLAPSSYILPPSFSPGSDVHRIFMELPRELRGVLHESSMCEAARNARHARVATLASFLHCRVKVWQFFGEFRRIGASDGYQSMTEILLESESLYPKSWSWGDLESAQCMDASS